MSALHILLRIPKTGRPIADVLTAHQAVIAKHKAVWLGIAGRPLSGLLINKLNGQIQRGANTFVYLVQKKADFELARGRILAVASEFPVTERTLIPRYYNENVDYSMKSWLKLESLLLLPDAKQLANLVVPSTGNSATKVLTNGMASLFCVTDLESSL